MDRTQGVAAHIAVASCFATALRVACEVHYCKRNLRTCTSGQEEWVSAKRTKFDTEADATAAITALWITEDAYKGATARSSRRSRRATARRCSKKTTTTATTTTATTTTTSSAQRQYRFAIPFNCSE